MWFIHRRKNRNGRLPDRRREGSSNSWQPVRFATNCMIHVALWCHPTRFLSHPLFNYELLYCYFVKSIHKWLFLVTEISLYVRLLEDEHIIYVINTFDITMNFNKFNTGIFLQFLLYATTKMERNLFGLIKKFLRVLDCRETSKKNNIDTCVDFTTC